MVVRSVLETLPARVARLPLALDWREAWLREGSWLRQVASVLLVVVLTTVAYRVVRRGLMALERRKRLPYAVVFLARRVVFWIAVVTAVLLSLQVLNVLENTWTAMTAMFALIGVGFIAVWSVLSNTLCAMLLILVRPFDIGDWIEIPGEAGNIKGKAVNFNLIYTTLRGEDGTLIQVPNNLFFQKPVKRVPGEGKVGLDEQLMKESESG
jgi:small-conductance mechanosensitive channel